MDLIWEKFTEWLKELLVGGIMDNLTGLFDNVNAKVAEAAGHIGSTPQAWNANIYSMIRSLSDNVILPIAGVILAFVMTLELIQLIADRNNLHDIDTWVFFRWVFKTAAAVLIVSNTWNIVMGVFEAAQSVVNRASGLIVGNTSINLADHIADLEARLLEMNVWTLLGLWLQSFVVGFTMWALTICIFIIIYGRMIEIYLVTSIAPIPMATMMGKEWGGMGQNYLRSLLALAFQGFLIIICIAIYAVLVQNERMFLLTFIVINTAGSRQQLDNNVFQAASIAQKYNCQLTRLDFRQEEGLMSSLPLGLNQIEIQRGLTTSSVAIFIPFTTQELFQDGKEALYCGLNALSNNLIMVDRKRLKNPKGVVVIRLGQQRLALRPVPQVLRMGGVEAFHQRVQ